MKSPERIALAIDFAVKYGGIDGDHHKAWVIDQMVRALTGCPMQSEEATDVNGAKYTAKFQGESPEYKKLIAEACDGEDGPDTWNWEIGIAS